MKMDKYLGRFRGVEPPRELRAKVLESARGCLCDGARDGSRDGRLLGVAAIVLVLLTAVNVHLEGRIEALASGGQFREAGPAKGGDGQPELVDPFQSPLRSRLAVRRTRKVGEQSWLKLRVDLERIKRVEG